MRGKVRPQKSIRPGLRRADRFIKRDTDPLLQTRLPVFLDCCGRRAFAAGASREPTPQANEHPSALADRTATQRTHARLIGGSRTEGRFTGAGPNDRFHETSAA